MKLYVEFAEPFVFLLRGMRAWKERDRSVEDKESDELVDGVVEE